MSKTVSLLDLAQAEYDELNTVQDFSSLPDNEILYIIKRKQALLNIIKQLEDM